MRKLAICTLALCLGFASITQASSVTKLKVKGNSASGGVSTPDDPCLSAFLSVQAFEQVTRDGTTNSETKEINFFFFGTDNCQSLSYSGFLTVPLTFALANQSKVTIPFDISVDVTPFDSDVATSQKRLVGTAVITATADFAKSRQLNITQNETTREVVRSKGTTRESTMTVSATLGGDALSFVPSDSAEIGTTKTGTIEVTRY